MIRRLWLAGIALPLTMTMSGCGSSSPSSAPTSTSTTLRIVVADRPPCLSRDLYEAAAKAEGFTAHSPGYSRSTGVLPGAAGARCDGDWAIATVSRPNVGTTDGLTVFQWVRYVWNERGILGFPDANCDLIGRFHIPRTTADRLILSDPATCLTYIAGSWNSNWTASSMSISPSTLTGTVFWKTRLDTYASADFSVTPVTTGEAVGTITRSNRPADLSVGTRFELTLVNLLSVKGPITFPRTWCSQETYESDNGICPGPVVG